MKARLNRGSNVYWAECLGISKSLGMVCTIVCVHTILRDARPRFKTGLPDAYRFGSTAAGSFGQERAIMNDCF
jgi:hypothetical protein